MPWSQAWRSGGTGKHRWVVSQLGNLGLDSTSQTEYELKNKMGETTGQVMNKIYKEDYNMHKKLEQCEHAFATYRGTSLGQMPT